MLEMKWYVIGNRMVPNAPGEAKSHIVTISDKEKPPYDRVFRLDFGYGRKDDNEMVSLIENSPELLKESEECLKQYYHFQREWDCILPPDNPFVKLASIIVKIKGA